MHIISIYKSIKYARRINFRKKFLIKFYNENSTRNKFFRDWWTEMMLLKLLQSGIYENYNVLIIVLSKKHLFLKILKN